MSAPGYSPEFIAASLRRSAIRSKDGTIEMVFVPVNGRDFLVQKLDDGRYCGSEMIPNGRIAAELPDGRLHCSNWKGHAAAAEDPNGYVEAARRDGIDEGGLVRTGGGFGVYTLYHDTLQEVAEKIALCLAQNVYYDDLDRAKMNDPEFKERLRREEEECRAAYRKHQQDEHDAATDREHGIFKGLHGMMGPLSDGAKQRILSFLNSPSNETWDDCARLMVKGGRTMWQLWVDADPAAPRSLGEDDVWPRIPGAEQMRQILKQAGGADPTASARPGQSGSRL